MNLPIVDLHCDLLLYLSSGNNRSPFDDRSLSSIPQMQKGNILLQTLAVFTETGKNSVLEATKQIQIFKQLPQLSQNAFSLYTKKENAITVVPAIENASGIISEDELLEAGLKRLDEWNKTIGPFLYVSLTWNEENRFGGGNATKIGLKEDGKIFLDQLALTKTAIDLSHTSDALAHDILNYIDQKKLSIIPIASHSNYRAIQDHPRNLPDDIAREIFKRRGIIGVNFVRPFIGNDPSAFIDHIEHALELGGEDLICFGADFFPEDDLPSTLDHLKPFFFPKLDNSSCYNDLLALLEKSFPRNVLEKISSANALKFLTHLTQKSG